MYMCLCCMLDLRALTERHGTLQIPSKHTFVVTAVVIGRAFSYLMATEM